MLHWQGQALDLLHRTGEDPRTFVCLAQTSVTSDSDDTFHQINVVAFSSDPDSNPDHYPDPATKAVEDVTTEEVMTTYENYGPEVKTLLSCMVNPTKWKINVVYPHIPPEKWTKGPVAILGDAVSTRSFMAQLRN